MVQSNVTARIRALEEQIGAALFERSNPGSFLPLPARLVALRGTRPLAR